MESLGGGWHVFVRGFSAKVHGKEAKFRAVMRVIESSLTTQQHDHTVGLTPARLLMFFTPYSPLDDDDLPNSFMVVSLVSVFICRLNTSNELKNFSFSLSPREVGMRLVEGRRVSRRAHYFVNIQPTTIFSRAFGLCRRGKSRNHYRFSAVVKI